MGHLGLFQNWEPAEPPKSYDLCLVPVVPHKAAAEVSK